MSSIFSGQATAYASQDSAVVVVIAVPWASETTLCASRVPVTRQALSILIPATRNTAPANRMWKASSATNASREQSTLTRTIRWAASPVFALERQPNVERTIGKQLGWV